jgi:hypothetical protein
LEWQSLGGKMMHQHQTSIDETSLSSPWKKLMANIFSTPMAEDDG